MKTWKKALGLVLALVCLTILSGGGLAESVTCDNVTLTRTDKELTANDYTFDKNTHLLTIKTKGEYTLSGMATSNDFRVKVVGESGQRIETKLTIKDLKINTEGEKEQGYSPLDFSEAGETTLILVGANQLTARSDNPAVFAPLVSSEPRKDAIPLTIRGDGSLVANGGDSWPGIGNTGSAKILIQSGNITAVGGGHAAGIGGSWGFWFDSIAITGGRVVATGGADARNDIGCGCDPGGEGHGSGRPHKISINGGVVEAERIYGQGDKEDRTALTHTSGTLIQNGNRTYMSDATLDEKVTISNGKTMKIGKGVTVTIGKNGGLEIADGATLYVDGTVQGNITGDGKIYYKLNYNLNGGNWAVGYTPTEYYQSGAEPVHPTGEKLNKAGYTFLSWNDKDAGKLVGIKNVDAQWKANTYDVSFNANGGTVGTQTRKVTYDSTYGNSGKLPTPTLDGYTFDGWYDDNGNLVNDNTVVTTAANHTLCAHWTANTYTVKFDANGGAVTPEATTVTYGDLYGELPTPTLEGYTFEGWFTEKDVGTQVTKETVVTTAADHMLHAHWTRISYEVKFDANGGIGTCKPINVFHGDTYGTFPPEPTLEGYEFAGWFTEKDGGTQVTKDTVVTASHTLYAHWTRISYEVKFDANGGIGTCKPINVFHGDAYGKFPPEPTRTGYEFAGWYTAEKDGTLVTEDTVVTASHTLYAHWTANEYTVTFDANKGTVTPTEMKVRHGDAYGKLPTPTLDGYTFDGWYNDNGMQVKPEDEVTASHTLYAHWKASTYTVTFEANEGTAEPKPQTVIYGSTYGKLPTLTRDGYTFAGWFTEQNGGTKVMADTKVKTAKDHTLYAHWTQNIYDVSFDANGGKEAYEPKKVRHGDVYGTFPLTPTRTGYEFAGWYTEKDGGAKVELGDVVTSSHTLYAHWTANEYTVTFDANGGTVTPETMKVTYGSHYGELPTPTRKGYTFVGWFTNPNGGTQVKADAEVTTAANRTLHAHWTQNIHTVTIKDDKDGKVIETQQIPEGGLAKKPAKEPVREGYTFIGWQANGAAWDFDKNVVERDTEIIALWEKVVIAPDVAIEGGTSFIVGRATENAMVTIGHNVPGFGVANLAYVDVDGKKLNEKDYDAKTGSIKLNVHAAYLNTLSVGEHTLTAHLKGDGYDGQKVSAKLTVSPVPDASGLPKTGDASAPMVWCALGLACLAGLAAMKRRK